MIKLLSAWRKNREIKQYQPEIAKIRDLQAHYGGLSARALAQSTEQLQARLGTSQTADEIRLHAFAAMREALRRATGLWAYESQLLGALAMSKGNFIELATGEGKTLLPAFIGYWNHLCGHHTHVCTSNDYLARRDALFVSPAFELLNVSVGLITANLPAHVLQSAYACDVVYGTPADFALDYLRDNVARATKDVVQVRGRQSLVIDEADSLLLDEAYVPFTIHAQVDFDPQVAIAVYDLGARLIACEQPSLRDQLERAAKQRASNEEVRLDLGLTDEQLKAGDFYIDPVTSLTVFTERGYFTATDCLVKHGLLPAQAATYTPEHQALLHRLQYSLTARHVFAKGVHYLVQDGRLCPIDQATGRVNMDRTWGTDLTQALEAKESLPISPERKELASMPVKGFLKTYSALVCGMSGTLASERDELLATYGFNVVEVPSNTPCVRVDHPDRIYATAEQKYDAVIKEVRACHAKGRPVLIGATSVAQSEKISELLEANGLAHAVINAKNHQFEAHTLAHAGQPGAITVATRMAGRGVDIILGGDSVYLADNARTHGDLSLSDQELNEQLAQLQAKCEADAKKVREAGGLCIIGLERFETIRQDQQLRGRAGRQGDPGSSVFFVSLEDTLLSKNSVKHINKLLKVLDASKDDKLEQALVQRVIDAAQRQVQEHQASLRASVLRNDDILGAQRESYYAYRQSFLTRDLASAELEEDLFNFVRAYRDRLFSQYNIDPENLMVWELKALLDHVREQPWGRRIDVGKSFDSYAELAQWFTAFLKKAYEDVGAQVENPKLRQSTRVYVVVCMLDEVWFAHCDAMKELRASIHLRQHARQNPQHALMRESAKAFQLALAQAQGDAGQGLLMWQWRATT